jgi:hypothetical protein
MDSTEKRRDRHKPGKYKPVRISAEVLAEMQAVAESFNKPLTWAVLDACRDWLRRRSKADKK